MNHFADPDFWTCYRKLPAEVRDLADKNFVLLKQDPAHPSLRFKKIGPVRSVRIGLNYRDLGHDCAEGITWFWIGPHGEYDRLLK